MRAAGLVLVTPLGRALFLKRNGDKAFNGGTWCFPGGKVEDGEQPVDAAIRETREETGFIASDDAPEPELVGENKFYDVTFTTYRLAVGSEFIPDLGDGEHIAYAWAPVDDPPQPLHPGMTDTLPLMAAADQQPALTTSGNTGMPIVKKAEDAMPSEAEHTITIKHNGDFNWSKFLRELNRLGAVGASRPVIVRDEDDQDISFGWDGDGADRIVSAEVNGTDVLAQDVQIALDEASVRTMRAITSVFALDAQSVRSYDVDGRLQVAKTPISKACVSPYLGREIPDWEAMGLVPSKIYYLLRDPEELAKGATSFNRIQLLGEHIPVNAENPQKEAIVGATGSDASFEYPYLFNSIVVWDQDAINEVEHETKKELSSAYRYSVDWTPGVFEGENYDGVMRDIIGNHVSLVKEGRAGPDVVVGDSAEELRKQMSVKIPTKRAAAAAGTLAYYSLPFLAKDQKLQVTDLLPAFAGMTAKNWSTKRADLVKRVGDILKPKLAADQATPDDVILRLVDMIDGGGSENAGESLDESVSPEQHNAMEAAAHGHSTLGISEKADEDKSSDAGLCDQICAALEGKVDPATLEQIRKICGGGEQAADENVEINNEGPDPSAPPGKIAEDDPEAFKGMPKPGGKLAGDEEKDMVTKTAMDAAITAAVKAERASQKAVNEARVAVRPHVGDLPLSYDSAEDVYGAALKALKVDITGVHPSAYRAILNMQPKPGTKTTTRPVMAADTANAAADFNKRFPEINRLGTV